MRAVYRAGTILPDPKGALRPELETMSLAETI